MMLRMAATPSLTSLSLRNPNLRFCISLFSPKPFSLCFLPNLRPSITTAAVAATSAAASGTTTITTPPATCSMPIFSLISLALCLISASRSQFCSAAASTAASPSASCMPLVTPVLLSTSRFGSRWEDFENFWSECPWEDDLKYAKAVCDQILNMDMMQYEQAFRLWICCLGQRVAAPLLSCSADTPVDVPLEVVHLTDEYWKNVVSYIIEEYRCGRTPNPDVLCNTRIKFGAFMDAISSKEFDYVASGHYANVVHSFTDQMDKPSVLELSKDMVKDQTYFLSHLSQIQLKRLIFPLGCIPKDEVRSLATKLDLPNRDRKDSQGICFLGKIKFSEFVARHIGEKEGIILEAETGDLLGKHRGFWFYTIGQRQGLRLPGGPWYVVEKDVKNNVVFVSRNYFSLDKRRRLFRVGSLKWISREPPGQINQLQCKVEILQFLFPSLISNISMIGVRHGPGFYNCSFTMEPGEDGHEDVAVVQLSEDDQGLAAGQFTAFYQGRSCIGSGVILESWDDQGFPVCAKALEIARMEDKSKLGKPVKIKVRPETPPKGLIKLMALNSIENWPIPKQQSRMK
ncbi:tRNA-specific 2-thiouridylase MnmA [Vitis vinifera]|uniref:tRNA-5-taurinomethyluridine 2-sulfurtransferase n=1 Tax=Vitis vinifera TaxID=29760 RepID=A0A438DBG1_VITVI|nr:tRNA-specific 2-thiouridylase MnmA [Vitis vinifera]